MYRSHLDGVPAFHFTDSGSLHAALRFGVGTRDESFRSLGITRLVAALAVDGTRRQFPGGPRLGISVGIEETRFTVSGAAEDVVACLTALCVALSDPPTERLEEVARALRHGGGESADPRAVAALNARYGSHAAGLECGEHGWHHLPTADMASNAVLTSTGPDPSAPGLPRSPRRVVR
jgi:hypothetical protein